MKKKTLKELFLEAIENGDNLEIFKVQRKILAIGVFNEELEEDEKSRIHRDIKDMTKEIIKLEGSRELQTEEALQEMKDIDDFRKDFKGGL